MKLRVVYDVDGTQSMVIEGPVISSQIMPDGRGMVIVRTKKGREVRVIHFARAYYMDKDKA